MAIPFPAGSALSRSSCNMNGCPGVPGNDLGGIQVGEVLSILAVRVWKLMGVGHRIIKKIKP